MSLGDGHHPAGLKLSTRSTGSVVHCCPATYFLQESQWHCTLESGREKHYTTYTTAFRFIYKDLGFLNLGINTTIESKSCWWALAAHCKFVWMTPAQGKVCPSGEKTDCSWFSRCVEVQGFLCAGISWDFGDNQRAHLHANGRSSKKGSHTDDWHRTCSSDVPLLVWYAEWWVFQLIQQGNIAFVVDRCWYPEVVCDDPPQISAFSD